MRLCVFEFLFFVTSSLVHHSHSTIDINLAEFQYIADHLTEKECHQLVTALHFHTFELPTDINTAVRKLSDDVSCIDLLLHWNSTPREGRGKTHIEVYHRLSQIGREDLAKWLSKTVFHAISNDLKFVLNAAETEDTSLRPSYITEECSNEEIIDEAGWWKIDSILEILAVMGLLTFIFGSFFVCFLCCTRSRKYRGKLSTEN